VKSLLKEAVFHSVSWCLHLILELSLFSEELPCVFCSHASTTWPCAVLERVKTELGADSYTIMLYSHPAFDEDDEGAIPPDVSLKVTGVPRDALVFVDQPDSTDVDKDNAFRHAIHVPEGVFPDAWLDIKVA
jgi:hypothetical protein